MVGDGRLMMDGSGRLMVHSRCLMVLLLVSGRLVVHWSFVLFRVVGGNLVMR